MCAIIIIDSEVSALPTPDDESSSWTEVIAGASAIPSRDKSLEVPDVTEYQEALVDESPSYWNEASADELPISGRIASSGKTTGPKSFASFDTWHESTIGKVPQEPGYGPLKLAQPCEHGHICDYLLVTQMGSDTLAKMTGEDHGPKGSPGKASIEFMVQVEPHTQIQHWLTPATSWLIQGKYVDLRDDLGQAENAHFKNCAVHMVQSHSGEVHSLLLQKSHNACKPWMHQLLISAATTLTPVMQHDGSLHTDTRWGHKSTTWYAVKTHTDGHTIQGHTKHHYEVMNGANPLHDAKMNEMMSSANVNTKIESVFDENGQHRSSSHITSINGIGHLLKQRTQRVESGAGFPDSAVHSAISVKLTNKKKSLHRTNKVQGSPHEFISSKPSSYWHTLDLKKALPELTPVKTKEVQEDAMWDLVAELPSMKDASVRRTQIKQVMAMPHAQKAFVQAVSEFKIHSIDTDQVFAQLVEGIGEHNAENHSVENLVAIASNEALPANSRQQAMFQLLQSECYSRSHTIKLLSKGLTGGSSVWAEVGQDQEEDVLMSHMALQLLHANANQWIKCNPGNEEAILLEVAPHMERTEVQLHQHVKNKRWLHAHMLLSALSNSRQPSHLRAIQRTMLKALPSPVDEEDPHYHGQLQTRVKAIRTLADIGGQEAEATLLGLLKDPHYTIRSEAAKLLPEFVWVHGQQMPKRKVPEYVQATAKVDCLDKDEMARSHVVTDQGGQSSTMSSGTGRGTGPAMGSSGFDLAFMKTFTYPDDASNTKCQLSFTAGPDFSTSPPKACVGVSGEAQADVKPDNDKFELKFSASASPAFGEYVFPNALGMYIHYIYKASDNTHKDGTWVLGIQLLGFDFHTGKPTDTKESNEKQLSDMLALGITEPGKTATQIGGAALDDVNKIISTYLTTAWTEKIFEGRCNTEMTDTASEGAEKTGTKQNGVWSATLVKFYAMFMTPIGIIITIELSVGGAFGYDFHIARTGTNDEKVINVRPSDARKITQKCAKPEPTVSPKPTGGPNQYKPDPIRTGHTVVFEPFVKAAVTIELSVNFLVLKLGIGGELELVRLSAPMTGDLCIATDCSMNCAGAQVRAKAATGSIYLHFKTLVSKKVKFVLWTMDALFSKTWPDNEQFWGKCWGISGAGKEQIPEASPEALDTYCIVDLYSDEHYKGLLRRFWVPAEETSGQFTLSDAAMTRHIDMVNRDIKIADDKRVKAQDETDAKDKAAHDARLRATDKTDVKEKAASDMENREKIADDNTDKALKKEKDMQERQLEHGRKVHGGSSTDESSPIGKFTKQLNDKAEKAKNKITKARKDLQARFTSMENQEKNRNKIIGLRKQIHDDKTKHDETLKKSLDKNAEENTKNDETHKKSLDKIEENTIPNANNEMKGWIAGALGKGLKDQFKMLAWKVKSVKLQGQCLNAVLFMPDKKKKDKIAEYDHWPGDKSNSYPVYFSTGYIPEDAMDVMAIKIFASGPHALQAPDSHSDACHLILYEKPYWVDYVSTLITASPAGQEMFLGSPNSGKQVKSFRMIGNCKNAFFVYNSIGAKATDATCNKEADTNSDKNRWVAPENAEEARVRGSGWAQLPGKLSGSVCKVVLYAAEPTGHDRASCPDTKRKVFAYTTDKLVTEDSSTITIKPPEGGTNWVPNVPNDDATASPANLYCPSAVTYELSHLHDPASDKSRESAAYGSRSTFDMQQSCVNKGSKCYANPLQVRLKYSIGSSKDRIPFSVYSQLPGDNAGLACYGSTKDTKDARWNFQCGAGECVPGCPKNSFTIMGEPTPTFGTKYNGACPDYSGMEEDLCRNSEGVCGEGKDYCATEDTKHRPVWTSWQAKNNIKCDTASKPEACDKGTLQKADTKDGTKDARSWESLAGTQSKCVCQDKTDAPAVAGKFECKACVARCPEGSVVKPIRVHIGRPKANVGQSQRAAEVKVQVCGAQATTLFCPEFVDKAHWLQRGSSGEAFNIKVDPNAIIATKGPNVLSSWLTDLQFMCMACQGKSSLIQQQLYDADYVNAGGNHVGPLRPRINGVPDIVDSEEKSEPRSFPGQRAFQTHDNVERMSEAWSECNGATITHKLGKALMLAFTDVAALADPTDTNVVGPVVKNSFTVYQYLLANPYILEQRYCCPNAGDAGQVRILRRETERTQLTGNLNTLAIEAVCVGIDPKPAAELDTDGLLNEKLYLTKESKTSSVCAENDKHKDDDANGEPQGGDCDYRIWHPVYARSCSAPLGSGTGSGSGPGSGSGRGSGSEPIQGAHAQYKVPVIMKNNEGLGVYNASENEGCSLRWFKRHAQVFGKGSTAVVGTVPTIVSPYATGSEYGSEYYSPMSPLAAIKDAPSVVISLFAGGTVEGTQQLSHAESKAGWLPVPKIAVNLHKLDAKGDSDFVYRFNEGDLVYKDGNCKVYQVIGRECAQEGKTYYTKTYKIKDAEGKDHPGILPRLLSPADPDWPRYKVQDGTVLSPEAVSIVLNWGENCPHKTQD